MPFTLTLFDLGEKKTEQTEPSQPALHDHFWALDWDGDDHPRPGCAESGYVANYERGFDYVFQHLRANDNIELITLEGQSAGGIDLEKLRLSTEPPEKSFCGFQCLGRNIATD